MHMRNCITTVSGMTCYEHISFVESFKTYMIFRMFEYIIKESFKDINTKLVMQSLDGIAFS